MCVACYVKDVYWGLCLAQMTEHYLGGGQMGPIMARGQPGMAQGWLTVSPPGAEEGPSVLENLKQDFILQGFGKTLLLSGLGFS